MTATLDRIAALLAKAERTDNEAEADAYLMKAQTLATLASVDLAVARARTAHREGRHQPVARTTTIGEKARRANPHLIALFVAVAHANDVKVDVAANSTYVIGYGLPEDLDAAEAIFGSLAVHMVHAGQGFVGARAWVGERYVAVVSGRRTSRVHTAQTARAGFYRAYVARISERLEQARQEAVARAVDADRGRGSDAVAGAPTSGVALVLKRKSAQVDDFHRRTSSARGSWGGYAGGVRSASGSAAQAGRQAASRARLTVQHGLPGPASAVGG